MWASSTRRHLSSYKWTITYLEKADKTIRQKEAIREQSHTLKQDKKSSTMLEKQEKTVLKMKASLCDIRKMSLFLWLVLWCSTRDGVPSAEWPLHSHL